MRKFGLIISVLLLFGFVLSGCDDGDKEEERKGFTVTITGLPDLEQGTGKIYGASLLNPDDITVPIAVGTMNSREVFEFFHPIAGTQLPSSEPFATNGTYIPAIARTTLINPTNPEKIYLYNAPPVTFSSTNKDFTFNWSDFKEK
jgi:hypothetical protein